MNLNYYGINVQQIKFDLTFYKTFYKDLSNLNNDELIQHYISHGKREQRIFCDIQTTFDWLQYYIDYKLEKKFFNDIYDVWKHYLYNYYKYLHIKYKEHLNKDITKINNTIEFNHSFYSNEYTDLSNLNKNDLYSHFHKHGRKERRMFCSMIRNFNWFYYYFTNENLSVNNVDNLWIHFIYNGIKENKFIDYLTIVDFSLNNLNDNQKLVYNNILIDPSNNSNNNSYSSNSYSITSHSSTSYNSSSPKTAIIYVYYNRKNELRNETNLAFFIRQTVLRDNKNLYMFIINGNLTEVVIPQQNNVIVYKNRNCYDIEAYGFGIKYILNRDKSIQRFILMNCGVTGPFCNGNWLQPFENKINKEKAVICSTICYRFSGVKYNPGYFNYIVNDSKVINLLLTVLINHRTKVDAINNGEYGISKVLHKNGYKITSLVDNRVEGYRADRDNNINSYNLNSLIFVKTNWRSLDGINRDSLPLKNHETINYINNNCNFKYDKFNVDCNYLSISSSTNGWKSKHEFYNKYGTPEEFIVYPNINNNSNKLALYCHSDNDNLFRSYCVDAVNTLSCLGYKVIICTTCHRFNNVDNLPYQKIVMSNAKIDTFMIKSFLNSNNINNYSNLLCVNDSIIFPIHGINNMRNTFNKFNNTDFWGIWSSPEQKEHIMSPFLHYSNRTFNFLKSILNKYSLTDFSSAQQWEVNMLQEMKSKNFSTGCVVDYRTLGDLKFQCPIMHPNVFPKWINRPEVFAIKWKYIGNYLNKNKLNIPYMNYLLRYLHFNHTGMKGKPELHGAYGNPANYV